MAKKDKTVSGVKYKVRSPMDGYRQNEDLRCPTTEGTTEVIHGSMKKVKPAPVRSPNKSGAVINKHGNY